MHSAVCRQPRPTSPPPGTWQTPVSPVCAQSSPEAQSASLEQVEPAGRAPEGAQAPPGVQ